MFWREMGNWKWRLFPKTESERRDRIGGVGVVGRLGVLFLRSLMLIEASLSTCRKAAFREEVQCVRG